jgi:hypothetical protein
MHNKELCNLYSPSSIIIIIKSKERDGRDMEHERGEKRNAYRESQKERDH